MRYVLIVCAAAIWTASWFPDPPKGPVVRFGLESNTAAFLINTAALIALIFLIRNLLLAWAQQEADAKNDPSMAGRFKWYGLNYLDTLLVLGLLGGLHTYLTGESPGFTFGLESEFARFIANSIVTSVIATPLYMWQDAAEERRQKNNQRPGFVERLGLRAGRYLRRSRDIQN